MATGIYAPGPWLTNEGARIDALEDAQAGSHDPTGYDLRDPDSQGIMELCPSAVGGKVWRIDQNGAFTELLGQVTFGDGVTPLADRTFAHYPVPGHTIKVWHVGVLTELSTAQTLQLPATPGIQPIAYNTAGALIIDHSIYDLIRVHAITAVVTGNPTLGDKVVFASERHGKEMSNATHYLEHMTIGARWGSGMDITGLTDGGDTFAEISAGEIFDEDLCIARAKVTACPFIYRDADGDWARSAVVDDKLAYFHGGSDVVWNRDNGDGTWDMVPIASTTDYVIMLMFATNDAEHPVFKVVGQQMYTSRAVARERISSEIVRLKMDSIPTPEFAAMYVYIVRGGASGAILKGADDEVYYDYRDTFPAKMF